MGSSVSKEFRRQKPKARESENPDDDDDGVPFEPLYHADPDLDLGGQFSISVDAPPGSGHGWIFGPEYRARRLEDVYVLKETQLGKGHFGIVRVGVKKENATQSVIASAAGKSPWGEKENETVVDVHPEPMTDSFHPVEHPGTIPAAKPSRIAWGTGNVTTTSTQHRLGSTVGHEVKEPPQTNAGPNARRKFHSFFPEIEEEEREAATWLQAGAVVGATGNGKEFAVKSIEKAKVRDVRLLRWEVEILKKLDHPNLLSLRDVFEDDTYIHLVTDLYMGGEVFRRIHDRGRLTEPEAARMMRMILHALKWCHDRNIVHRDLKPENFLLSSTGDAASLIVIDFGLAILADPTAVLESRVGTYYYMSPELLSRRYNRPTDMWSCGVIAFVLLAGYPPFFGDHESMVLKRIQSGHYSFEDPAWWRISEDAKDFVARLLAYDPRTRMTAEGALRHPWIINEGQAAIPRYPKDLLPALKKFGLESSLKRLAKLAIAKLLPSSDKKFYGIAFDTTDLDADGFVSRRDLFQAIRRHRVDVTEEEVDIALLRADCDGDKRLSREEFLAAILPKQLILQENFIEAAFNSIDIDGDGIISERDLQHFYPREVVSHIASSHLQQGVPCIDYANFLRCVVGNEREVEFVRRQMDEQPRQHHFF